MNAFLNTLQTIDNWVGKTARAICIVCLMLIFILFLANVFVRFVPVYNFTQTDDWIQLLLVWMIFLGAQELVRTRSHFVVDVLTERLGGTQTGRVCHVLVCLIELTTYAVIFWFGCEWVSRAHAYMQSIPWLQMRWAYAAIPVSAFFMTCYGVRDLIIAVRHLIMGEDEVTKEETHF